MKINNISGEIKILYVEDSDELREEMLEILGYYFQNIYLARDGQEGFELYKSEFEKKQKYFDIVISDVEMPNMDGIIMCKKIKEINKNQIVVLLSAYDTKEHLKEAIDLGVDKFVVKPVVDACDFISLITDLSKKALLDAEYRQSDFLLKQKNKIIDENVFMTVSDLAGKIVEISQAYLDFTGYTREQIIGKNHSIFRNKSTNKEIIKNLWDTILDGKEWIGELKNTKFTKEDYWIKTKIRPLYDIDGQKVGYWAIAQDISNAKRLEALSITDPLTDIHNTKYFDYSLSREYKSALWKKEKFGLLLIDVDNFKDYNELYGNLRGDKALRAIASLIKTYINHTTQNIFRVGGKKFAIFVVNKTNESVEQIAKDLVKRVEDLKIPHQKNQASKYISISIGAINIDCSKEKISNEDIYNLADYNLSKAKNSGKNRSVFCINALSMKSIKNLDVMTKLQNRQVLIQDLSTLQQDAMLILLHINQISSIKDLYGMDAVKEIISQKTKHLSQMIRDKEATLYSLNVQEFAILVTSRVLFKKYMELLKYSILVSSSENECLSENEQCHISEFSAGVSYGILNLFNHANIALEDAIVTKKSMCIYNNNQTTLELQKTNLNRLKVYKKALHDGNIVPYFQPIIDAKNDSVIKYEALARLVLDNGEVVSPCHFLDSSKQDNSFEYFTRQMMQKVFNIYANKKADISINITYENISSKTMQEYIKNRLQKYGGDGITFEIVESEDIKNYLLVQKFIKMVKEYNCKISIDDFGSGYSNFTNIIKLDIDYIKLDGSLIEKLNSDKNVEHMVVALLSFVKNANIKTIAEFVSTKELDAKVKELGVDYVQGYLYGEPRSAKSYGLE